VTAALDAVLVGVVPNKRRVIHACLAIVVASSTLLVSTKPAQAAVVDDIRGDANWILSAAMGDGAIANYPDKQAIWPYLANFAAMGLARATVVTKDRSYVEAAWRWLAWYQGHMDTQGFVTDYVVKNGAPVSTGSMDSTDAYAGTFLIAARDAYRASLSTVRLRSLRTGISSAVKAIEATQASDGLTWAKPTWKVKYLMDQGEAYAGLSAADELAGILKDSSLARRARSDAGRMLQGVAGLWNDGTRAYDWAAHADGGRVATDWSFLYPDALQQPWAVAFGLVEPPRATALMTGFGNSQPKWAAPDELALFRGGTTEKVGYWPVAGLGFYRVGSAQASPAVASIRSASIAARRAWPFTTGSAGQLVLFEGFTLPGAITFDAKTVTVTATATRTSSTSATLSPVPTASASPSSTPISSTPTPTASPAPTAALTTEVGPVSAGVSVGSDGSSVYATVGPSSAPRR
jgi:hypothetical protein